MQTWTAPIRKAVIAATLTGAVVAGTVGIDAAFTPQASASASSDAAYQHQLVVKTLNSFYKPALQGKFPGDMNSFTIGKTTRSEVIARIGTPDMPRSSVNGYDTYHADMGQPGYAFHYNKNGVLDEMRYFGTNVERQTNIGGMTMKLLREQWYAPSSVSTIGKGKSKQTEITYLRGHYKLEFIFNSSTDLDHINLLKA
ncbi:YjgB family protein [Paenibacillus campi]|uniref:YjgB family protein n=1 Tax=Paenibacillus campi TaxID=3106031 RepID=UPI002AFF4614|nr:YjgB family protein [Paenibacillus sp. SGZ-1014]